MPSTKSQSTQPEPSIYEQQKLRRREQNRLQQRKRRARLREQGQQAVAGPSSSARAGSSSADPARAGDASTCLVVRSYLATSRVRRVLQPDFTYIRMLYHVTDAIGLPRDIMDEFTAISPIPSDYLAFLDSQRPPSGLDISPLAAAFATAAPSYRWRNVGPSFIPTPKQLAVAHHPYIDLGFPWPELRESICTLLELDMLDDDKLCDDVSTLGTLDGNEPAFILRGANPLNADD